MHSTYRFQLKSLHSPSAQTAGDAVCVVTWETVVASELALEC